MGAAPVPALKFWLGTHEAHWLKRLAVPLFVSHRRLSRIKTTLPVARAEWALDSGGFTEVSMHGGWKTTVDEYDTAVARYRVEVGQLAWAAPMDWMCEPFVIATTGLSVYEHQHRTVENFLELRSRSPIYIPVLQGWTINDYLECVKMYENAGVNLAAERIVGVGSVCRRQSEPEIGEIMRTLSGLGISLHGFGVKKRGFKQYGQYLTSADSLAWSYNARRNPPLEGCTHKSCANCHKWALRWAGDLLPATT